MRAEESLEVVEEWGGAFLVFRFHPLYKPRCSSHPNTKKRTNLKVDRNRNCHLGETIALVRGMLCTVLMLLVCILYFFFLLNSFVFESILL